MACISAYAASSTEDIDNRNLEETVTTKPENLVEYAAQRIDKLKEEGVTVSAVAAEVISPLEKRTVQQAGVLQGDSGLTGDYNENYYALDKLNAGLPPLSEPPNLSTPLATLEFFQSAVMNQQYDLAAYALNMNLIDGKLQRSRAIDLAKQLDFLLIEKKLYVFDELPDRPDGLIEPPLGSTNSIQGIPRRSIQLGYIDYRERRVPIHLERVRIDDSAPFWVFSAQTVGNIDNLYEQYHPAKFERYLPAWTKLQLFSIAIWEFLALLVFFSFTMGVGWLLSKGAGKLLNWYVKDKAGNRLSTVHHNSVEDLVNKLTVPLTFTISFSSVFTLVSGGFPYLDAVASSTRPIIWIGLVFSAMWLGIRVINFFANRYQDMQIENLGEEQFDKVRRRRTYVSIFRRVFVFVMVLGSIWIGLSEFANMEGFGKTLLTSAGIAGVVIGIAAQPILGNIIAGVQVAVTQPVRIGDSVIMDGNFSTVEDLRYTYAVLKTWDERRLIVPMRELITEMVENWSHTEVHQTCPVFLYIDYGADIDAIRQQFISVVKDNKLWDNKTEPEIFVVEVTEKTIQLRGAVSAVGPVEAWTLACEIREQMLDYLYREQKHYLPAEHLVLRQK
ncbi:MULTISPECIES: mechanosensitive ion channel family protein [unclassified Psychrobacter]|uniref:mechanosensitive ion channel family protein n=1 Tax=unclassified Psychrobacter TaxID=196806 RepID=UPI001918046D|nr:MULTISPECIES: mechanosensitive ion channel family protein [unclassified Psychrobacter]|tara:strand:- start:11823 stop:13664 length:1842 start_codon:yes stop_codon:yes gene_type:complete